MAIAKVANIANVIDELKEKGVWTFAAEAGGEDYTAVDFDCPVAIVLGSEGEGVSRLVRENCDFIAELPMPGGFESLNAGVATAITLYEILRQRGC